MRTCHPALHFDGGGQFDLPCPHPVHGLPPTLYMPVPIALGLWCNDGYSPVREVVLFERVWIGDYGWKRVDGQ